VTTVSVTVEEGRLELPGDVDWHGLIRALKAASPDLKVVDAVLRLS